MRFRTYLLLLIFIGLLVYFVTLFNGFVGDDFPQIIENARVHSITNIVTFFSGSTYESGGAERATGIFYRPIMLTVFSLLYTIFGANPLPFHLLQILLYITNAVLLFIFLREFFKERTAFIVTLLFLVHPINNEAVVYSANLQEVLFFFFGMLALLVARTQKLRQKDIGLLSVLFLLCLLSKEAGVLFIAITLLYRWLFKKKNIRGTLLSAGIALGVYAVLRYPVAHMYTAQGSIAPIYSASLALRLVNIPAVIFYYIKTFVFPIGLGSDQFWIVQRIDQQHFYQPLLLTLGVFGMIGWLGSVIYQKTRKVFTVYLFFCLWFAIGLLLHLQIIPLDATVADRWFYFPIVGFLGMLVVALEQVKFSLPVVNKTNMLLVIIIIAMFSLLTFQRTLNWKNGITLYAHDIKTTPENFVLDNAYGTELIINSDYKKAKPYIISSVREYPYYANLNNLAIIYASEKKWDAAKKALQQAAAVTHYYKVYENYSSFLLTYDDLKEGKAFTQSALGYYPHNAKLWLNLAKIDYLLGDNSEASRAARTAFTLAHDKETFIIYSNLVHGIPVVIQRGRPK